MSHAARLPAGAWWEGPMGNDEPKRVVPLIASATEIVCALGARDRLVGRSYEWTSPKM